MKDNINKQHLLNKINEIINEIEFRKKRINYNIIAGVSEISIKTQRKEIFYLERQLQSLEYKLQHELP